MIIDEKSLQKMLLSLESRVSALEEIIGFSPSADMLISKKKTSLVQLLHAYIYKHYDLGSLLSFLFMFQDESMPPEIKGAITGAGEWLRAVMIHYCDVAHQIRETGAWVDPEFESNFDDLDPRVNLESLIFQMAGRPS